MPLMLAAIAALSTTPVALSPIRGQGASPEVLQRINKQLDAGEVVTLSASGVKVSRFDFKFEDRNVEAVLLEPIEIAKRPGVLLIPGYMRTARDYIGFGARVAAAGFVCVAVTQPGWGKSDGKSDFVGPMTMRTMDAAMDRLKALPQTDPERLAVYGYSRGGMAASLMAVSRTDLKAAVFGSGLYDFKAALEEVTLEGIRKNMEEEAGSGEPAVDVRSSIRRMEKLACPVLIIHGEKDVNAPVSQAKRLDSRLNALKREHELLLYPDADHTLAGTDAAIRTIAFLKKVLIR